MDVEVRPTKVKAAPAPAEAPLPSEGPRGVAGWFKSGLVQFTLIFWLIVVVLPMLWTVMTSLKKSSQIFAQGPWAAPSAYFEETNLYLVWADCTTSGGVRYELDFLLKGANPNKVGVKDVKIHEREGVPLYSWQKTWGGWRTQSLSQGEGAKGKPANRPGHAAEHPPALPEPAVTTQTAAEAIRAYVAEKAQHGDGYLGIEDPQTHEKLQLRVGTLHGGEPIWRPTPFWTTNFWAHLLANYEFAWRSSEPGQEQPGAQFGRYMLNSFIITTATLILVLFVSGLAAYVLGHLKFKGRDPIMYYFLAGMTLPVQLALVPLFFLVLKFGLFETAFKNYLALILIYTSGALPFTVFILASFTSTLPDELHDAASIDGCSEYAVFFRVMLPLMVPGLITVAIFNFIGFWNEYFYALVFLTDEKRYTLPLGLFKLMVQRQYSTDVGGLFAGVVIVLLPTLIYYAFLQKFLTKGLTAGAIKG